MLGADQREIVLEKMTRHASIGRAIYEDGAKYSGLYTKSRSRPTVDLFYGLPNDQIERSGSRAILSTLNSTHLCFR